MDSARSSVVGSIRIAPALFWGDPALSLVGVAQLHDEGVPQPVRLKSRDARNVNAIRLC